MKPIGEFWPTAGGERRKPMADVDVPMPGKKLPPSVEEKLKNPSLGAPLDDGKGRKRHQ